MVLRERKDKGSISVLTGRRREKWLMHWGVSEGKSDVLTLTIRTGKKLNLTG